ncbi:hypothetical protein [Dictyobacter aurantiacus]|nr:hypothetical protein [Dictyobacter aurantiacus]
MAECTSNDVLRFNIPNSGLLFFLNMNLFGHDDTNRQGSQARTV